MSTMGEYSPWRDLASRPDVVLERVAFDDEDGRVGWCERGRIVLDSLQRRTQLRCTLAHELAHIDLGHVDEYQLPGRYWETRREVLADQVAARRLVSIELLVDALVWSGGDWWQLSDACNVTLQMAEVRVKLVRSTPGEMRLVRLAQARCEVAA